MVSPTISRFIPINVTADSFKIIAELSVANSLEQSLPSCTCQPMVLPKSSVTAIVPKLGKELGSFPCQLNPIWLDHTLVVGLEDSAILSTTPVARRSEHIAS